MGKNKTDRPFWESANLNNATFMQYYNRLIELSVSMFEWKNLPETIDVRYLELALFSDGQAVFFKDEEMGFLALRCTISGPMNVYRIPIKRRAYAENGYNNSLDQNDSVLIFNNYLHNNSVNEVNLYARRLYNIDRTIDVNINAQKTPILIQCEEAQYLTMKNIYAKYDGNEPVIMANANLNPNAIKVLQTGAPFVSDRLYEMKTHIWNEALTYLGISNIDMNKKERLLSDEIARNMGGTIASRYSRLEARKDACKQINAMFGLDVQCEYREQFNTGIENGGNSDGDLHNTSENDMRITGRI